MKALVNTLVATSLLFGAGAAVAANHDPKVIIPLLSASKLSLVEGIELAQKTHGPATSAKFEVNDAGKLVLSVYTIPEGFGVEPEKATLSEVLIDPTADQPQLNLKVFPDKEHIARAASHMTLFRLSPLTLADVLRNASRETKATPIDVRNPTVRDKRPVAEVLMFDANKQPLTVVVDLLSGSVTRK
jgi:hypothetical protein